MDERADASARKIHKRLGFAEDNRFFKRWVLHNSEQAFEVLAIKGGLNQIGELVKTQEPHVVSGALVFAARIA